MNLENPAPTRRGPGRVLVAGYALFAVAATSRAGFQLLTKGDEAPLAYGLSALAAVIYVVATLALAAGGPAARRVAGVALSVELIGVVTVGTASIVEPRWFGDDTVWSRYGLGYLLFPLILPVVGLVWLRRTRTDGQNQV